ncbi:MAG: hypothetical protein IPK82_23800 [Polyangiaceae bacterium]|nr:hypothetical protein [Polyangiaceae bacterium]
MLRFHVGANKEKAVRRWSMVVFAILMLFGACNPYEESSTEPTPEPLAIGLFTAQTLWGDAPLQNVLFWQIDAPEGATIHCELDPDGDGDFDVQISDCPTSGEYEVTLEEVGAISVGLRAKVGEEVAEAQETLFVNGIDWAPNLVRVRALPGLVSSVLGEDGAVTLIFNDEAAVPPSALVRSFGMKRPLVSCGG